MIRNNIPHKVKSCFYTDFNWMVLHTIEVILMIGTIVVFEVVITVESGQISRLPPHKLKHNTISISLW